MVKDPNCGMEVDEQKAVKAEKNGKVFYFCSEKCKNEFLAKKMNMSHDMHGEHEHHEHHESHKQHEHMEHGGHEHHDHSGHSIGGTEGGHDHHSHHEHMVADFKKRFWLSLVLTLPVLALSPMIQKILGLEQALHIPGDLYILFVLSSVVFFYGGWPFLKGLFEELKKKQPGMMTLIALAITSAYVYSCAVVFGLSGKIFFWELVTLVDIMLLGHWIEMKSVMGASRALEELAKLMPSDAHKLMPDGSIKDIPLNELETDNKVIVKPGEKIPADGVVVEGESSVNEAMLTGESRPVSKHAGSKVIGGSINGEGSLTVEVKKTGRDSFLSQIVNLVREAQESKSKSQDMANRAAFWLTIIALALGTITFFAWFLIASKDFAFSLERTITVMVITCPHALGLAVPLVVAVSTALAVKNGLLIRNRAAFEKARNIQAIIFDKTGTLTQGTFGITDTILFLDDMSEAELLKYAASVEARSEHPIAKGIVSSVKGASPVEGFKSIPGKGAEGNVNNKNVKVVTHLKCTCQEKSLFLSRETEFLSAVPYFCVITISTIAVVSLYLCVSSSSRQGETLLHQSPIWIKVKAQQSYIFIYTCCFCLTLSRCSGTRKSSAPNCVHCVYYSSYGYEPPSSWLTVWAVKILINVCMIPVGRITNQPCVWFYQPLCWFTVPIESITPPIKFMMSFLCQRHFKIYPV